MCHLQYYCGLLPRIVVQCSQCDLELSVILLLLSVQSVLCCSLWQRLMLRYFVFVRVLSSVVTLG